MPVAKKRKTLTPAQRLAREKRIIADLNAGKLSYRQIAAKHSVSLPTVNAKARKAGISRSRRGPAARATTRRVVRKATARARTTTRAKARTKTTRKAAATTMTARKTTRKPTRAVARRTVGRSAERFQTRFRELVMTHYPNMSLRNFEKLTKAVEKVLP